MSKRLLTQLIDGKSKIGTLHSLEKEQGAFTKHQSPTVD